ncbi:hypothetical protein ACWERV_24905 [Streptomyces sp. NPDC004031]
MSWDQVTLLVLASFGCLTLLLTQIDEVLSKVPPIIRAWRRVRDELRHGSHSSHGPSAAGPPDRERTEGEPDGS